MSGSGKTAMLTMKTELILENYFALGLQRNSSNLPNQNDVYADRVCLLLFYFETRLGQI